MHLPASDFALDERLGLMQQRFGILGKWLAPYNDGDTITVLDATHTQHQIRLTGIDAPEKRQAFGNVAKQSLVDMVAGQYVAVEWVKFDNRGGRKLGKVMLAGLDCNLEQVKRGLAWHYKQYQREQSPNDRRLYEAAENEARADKRGLWRDAEPVAPWEFRHQKKPGNNAGLETH
ncbi:thermonuclease family protein [Propionivibrio sp.]|uniref:thermonuclease family protein n=1 Tax=Propionivibrio sp. TaxID=2212460 RepID=UPI003BEFA567